jgi:hypothetical protein
MIIVALLYLATATLFIIQGRRLRILMIRAAWSEPLFRGSGPAQSEVPVPSSG